MSGINARLVGIELYFDDLSAARFFYEETLGLNIFGEQPGHHAQFNIGQAFLCLEKKGVENYPSYDKAVIFLEVPSVQDAVDEIGRAWFVQVDSGAGGNGPAWAVMHDPEGHNVLLIEAQADSES
jgi:catechol-2,3-dioxygenase